MLSLICNRATICKQSVKALMGISTEFYSDKIDINFIDVNAKSLWPFSTFVNQVLKFYPHFACSERLRKFPIKYGDLYICGRGVRKLLVQYWHRNHCCICLVVYWYGRPKGCPIQHNIIGIKHCFPCINICPVPMKVIIRLYLHRKTRVSAPGNGRSRVRSRAATYQSRKKWY